MKQFWVQWHPDEEPPPVNESHIVEQPTLLMSPYNLHSFGHLVLDNFQPLTEMARIFGYCSEQFSWLIWTANNRRNEQIDMKLVDHYLPWCTPWPALTFDGLRNQLPAGVLTTVRTHRVCERATFIAILGKHKRSSAVLRDQSQIACRLLVLISNMRAGVKFLRFKQIIAGRPAARQSSCTQPHWQPLRDTAYRLSGISHVPAASLPKQQVTILETQEHEPRGTFPALSRTFVNQETEE